MTTDTIWYLQQLPSFLISTLVDSICRYVMLHCMLNKYVTCTYYQNKYLILYSLSFILYSYITPLTLLYENKIFKINLNTLYLSNTQIDILSYTKIKKRKTIQILTSSNIHLSLNLIVQTKTNCILSTWLLSIPKIILTSIFESFQQ